MVADALNTNLRGLLRVLQAASPARRRSAGPRIVNNSSGAEAEFGLGEATASLATTTKTLTLSTTDNGLIASASPSPTPGNL